jgi:signal transduction histidine kinase/ligand-binding sensor domain-containing protein
MVKRKIFILSACLIGFFSLCAQNEFIYFEHLDNRAGLANNIVYDLVQDQKGYIWVATRNGLQRFDGTKFITVTPKSNAKGGTAVYKLLIDKKNILWFVTQDGIFQYQPSTRAATTSLLNVPLFNGSQITSLTEDFEGVIWICTPDVGLFFFDASKGEFISYDKKWPALKEKINSILPIGSSNRYWLNTSAGVVYYNAETRTYTNGSNQKIPISADVQFMPTRSDQLWYKAKQGNSNFILKGQGLGTSFSFLISEESAKDIGSIFMTKKGQVLAFGHSLINYQTRDSVWTDILNESTLNNLTRFDTIYSIMEDRDGLIWTATNNGIYIIKQNDLKCQYLILSEASDILVMDALQVSDTLIVVAARKKNKPEFFLLDGRLRKITSGKMISRISNTRAEVTAMTKDSEGVIWATTADSRLINMDFTREAIGERYVKELENENVMQVIADEEDNLWFVTKRMSLFKWSKKDNSFLKKTPCLKSNLAPVNFHLLYDKDAQSIWMASSTQLTRFDMNDERCEVFSFSEQLNISMIKEWEGDTLLFGTDHGIFLSSKIKAGQLQRLKTNTGYFNYNVDCFEIDRFNNIWVASSGNALFKIVNQNRFVINYNKQDGFFNQEFDHSFSLQLKDGRILIKTSNGFLAFYATHIPASYSNPRVRITGFSVNNRQINIDSLEGKELDLNWRENVIGFEFSSTSYAMKKYTQHDYMLEGADKNWITTTGDAKINYSNLAPGSYKFKIRSKTLFYDVLSDEDAVLFTVNAPFWNTVYFKIAVILLMISLVYLIYRIRIKRYLLVMNIKNRISRDLHDNIGSSLSSISIMLKVVMNMLDKTNAYLLLEKIATTTQLTQENLDDIVWNIGSSDSSLASIMDRLKEFGSNILETQHVRLDFNVPLEVRDLRLRLDKRYELYLIVKELINNTAKYAKATEIFIQLSIEENDLNFLYKDNGIGFDRKNHANGNGIVNIGNRSKNLRGKLIFESSVGNGTTVNLKFPIK